jgi:hypothetical protein
MESIWEFSLKNSNTVAHSVEDWLREKTCIATEQDWQLGNFREWTNWRHIQIFRALFSSILVVDRIQSWTKSRRPFIRPNEYYVTCAQNVPARRNSLKIDRHNKEIHHVYLPLYFWVCQRGSSRYVIHRYAEGRVGFHRDPIVRLERKMLPMRSNEIHPMLDSYSYYTVLYTDGSTAWLWLQVILVFQRVAWRVRTMHHELPPCRAPTAPACKVWMEPNWRRGAAHGGRFKKIRSSFDLFATTAAVHSPVGSSFPRFTVVFTSIVTRS